MAETADLAPTRRRAPANGTNKTRARAARTPDLEDQVQALQDDLKAITKTLTRISEEKVSEVSKSAKHEVSNLVNSGKQVVDDASDQVNALERQLKTMIRDKPLTAIGAAVGVGFILALMARM
jgi:ElaB/YqjD/DUF883 family membrane-anchored ribosome-binding protein